MHQGVIKSDILTRRQDPVISWPRNIRWWHVHGTRVGGDLFQLFLRRQRTAVATSGNMYTFALDINNSYYFVAPLKTTYPLDFKNLW